MARTTPVRDALAMIETILQLGDHLTPEARTERLERVARDLRAALTTRAEARGSN